jgi:hypothetical protein
MKHLSGLAILIPLLFLSGCDSSSGPADTGPLATEMRHQPLKVGDKWTAAQTETGTGNATLSVEITKDNATFNSEDVYEAALSMSVADFSDEEGTFRNFNGSGKMYIRKSDQEGIYHSLSTTADFTPAGETESHRIKVVVEGTSTFSVVQPQVLVPGLSWTNQETEHLRTTTYVDDYMVDDLDTTETHTRTYTTKAIANVSVKAGTFQAIEIDHDEVESGESTQEYYSQEAKTVVKEVTKEGGKVVSITEVRSIILSK